MRLAQSSSVSTNARQIGDHSTSKDATASPGPVANRQDEKPAALEVAIPLKKRSPSRASSTSTSGDGTIDYNTPATSVAMTPAESEIPQPKARVSASARARQLQSSTMSLSHRRGRKRNASAVVADETTPEASDAALARALQIEEYQEPLSKRRKVLDSGNSEVRDSDDDSVLTELDSDYDDVNEPKTEQWQPQRTRGSLRSAKKPIVEDSEDSNFDTDDMSQNDEDESHQSDSEPTGPLSSNQGGSLHSQSRPRNRNTTNTRGRGRGRRQAPRPDEAVPTASQTWMSYRVSSTSPFEVRCDGLLIIRIGVQGAKEA